MGNVHSRHKPTKKEDAWTMIFVGIIATLASLILLFLLVGLISTIFLSDKMATKPIILKVLATAATLFFIGYPFYESVRCAIESFREGYLKIKALKTHSGNESN